MVQFWKSPRQSMLTSPFHLFRLVCFEGFEPLLILLICGCRRVYRSRWWRWRLPEGGRKHSCWPFNAPHLLLNCLDDHDDHGWWWAGVSWPTMISLEVLAKVTASRWDHLFVLMYCCNGWGWGRWRWWWWWWWWWRVRRMMMIILSSTHQDSALQFPVSGPRTRKWKSDQTGLNGLMV